MLELDLPVEIAGAINKALQEAYERGRQKGAKDMLESIAKQARKSMSQNLTSEADQEEAKQKATHRKKRAAKGTVRALVQRMMLQEPKLTVPEYRNRALSLDKHVSGKSIENEIYRNNGKLYQRDGNRWFLIPGTYREKREDKDLHLRSICWAGGGDNVSPSQHDTPVDLGRGIVVSSAHTT